jgi:PmbA protein
LEQKQLQKIINDALDYAKSCGADSADAIVSNDYGFSVSARKGDTEEVEYHQEQAFSITLYQDQRTTSVSSTELHPAATQKLIDKAISMIRYTDKDPYAGLADKSLLAYDYPDLDLYHEWQIKPEEAIDIAIECESIARKQDSRITDSEGASVSTYSGVHVYGNTDGFSGGYKTSRHYISCGVVAKDGDDMQRDSEYTSARKVEDLQDVSVVAKQAAAKTLQRLHPRKIKTQKCPVIFHVDEAKGLLGSLIGAISGGSLYRKSSFLVDHLGKQIFPEHVHIYQQPHLQAAIGSRPFDYEGVRTERRDFVKAGVLESYVLGSYSARRLGLQSTGNAGGVFNLTITPSDMNLQTMLKEMGTGLLVTELIGQGVRIMTGDYSRGAVGFWVENGEIQFPVSEITVASNLRDMYQGIVAIADDVDLRGNVRTGSIWIREMMIAGE